ncbi:signal peptidase I [Paenibacillus beijingensis]|uniref:Signal peptidase I n=1 Tax=Paenibacillus beijingensis TaxID=1126833 RepID=A0A0D5NP28_9BACL|nr:signal peptidase I [Paenibacillus beijingensis]AJY76648.1 signal peptidase [Paenibacillus beijingensis]
MNNPSSPKKEPKRSLFREIREWTAAIVIAVAVSMLIRNYAFAQTEVHNVSMQKTLVEGQRLVEDKLSYRFSNPERGDIVIIKGPESELRLVKRVIGLPGDNLDMKNGHVYINGRLSEETYTKGETFPEGLKLPFTVPEGTVFVMGDNRENSQDSRELGPIRFSSLEGKVIFRLWPPNRIGPVR